MSPFLKPFVFHMSDQKTFELCRDALQRELESALLKPSRLSKELRLRILRKDHWSTHNKISGLTGLSHEDLLYFSMRFKETLFVNSLLQGNISADDARRMMLFLLHRVNFGPLPSFMLPEVYSILFPVSFRVKLVLKISHVLLVFSSEITW
jgi:secreted Zn-dependent insulinase-like peptidase